MCCRDYLTLQRHEVQGSQFVASNVEEEATNQGLSTAPKSQERAGTGLCLEADALFLVSTSGKIINPDFFFKAVLVSPDLSHKL